MHRHCAVVIGLLIACGQVHAVSADDLLEQSNDTGVQVADLKDQLEKGLQARLPREFRFIGTVVTMVQQKQLPLDLVKSAFQWARRQVNSRKYPFPYFERALRVLAGRRGIKIP